MPIFRREADSRSSTPNPATRDRAETPKPSATTLVAKGSKITGQITGDAPVHVSGALEGSIRVDQTVLISTEGRVEGDIQARTARIGGKVTGDVQATEKVEVTPSGCLEGNIRAPRVILEEGAFFKGQVEMAGETKRDASRIKSAAAAPGSKTPSEPRPGPSPQAKQEKSGDEKPPSPGEARGEAPPAVRSEEGETS